MVAVMGLIRAAEESRKRQLGNLGNEGAVGGQMGRL